MGQGPHNLGSAKYQPQEVTGGSLVLLRGREGVRRRLLRVLGYSVWGLGAGEEAESEGCQGTFRWPLREGAHHHSYPDGTEWRPRPQSPAAAGLHNGRS